QQRHEVADEPETAEDRQRDEADPDQNRIDAEVAAQTPGHATNQAVAPRPEQPPRPSAPGAGPAGRLVARSTRASARAFAAMAFSRTDRAAPARPGGRCASGPAGLRGEDADRSLHIAQPA